MLVVPRLRRRELLPSVLDRILSVLVRTELGDRGVSTGEELVERRARRIGVVRSR